MLIVDRNWEKMNSSSPMTTSPAVVMWFFIMEQDKYDIEGRDDHQLLLLLLVQIFFRRCPCVIFCDQK